MVSFLLYAKNSTLNRFNARKNGVGYIKDGSVQSRSMYLYWMQRS